MAAYFTVRGERYLPTSIAISRWSPTQVGGPAVCGLLARELEARRPSEEFVPARLTVDLFRPVVDEPLTLRSTVIRDGKRICVADAALVQGDEVRTRATVVFLRTGELPPGQVWQAHQELPVPPEDLPLSGSWPLFRSADGSWSHDFAEHQNAERKCIWQNPPRLVDGENATGFQRAAMLGDNTSMVCNWGSRGIGYINADMTLTLTRDPEGPALGLLAQDHIAAAGIAVGTAVLYDRNGALGTSVVSAVSNARRQVDLSGL